MYIRIAVIVVLIWLSWYIYTFIKINKSQLSVILKRAKYFYSNPIIKQTIIVSTVKFIYRIIRKTLFKFWLIVSLHNPGHPRFFVCVRMGRFGLTMKKVYILLVFIFAILQGQSKTIAVLEFDGSFFLSIYNILLIQITSTEEQLSVSFNIMFTSFTGKLSKPLW